MGLVEAGVGLIPAGGGTKEMIIRANERAEGEEDIDLFHALKPVFENIAMAKVSTSGEEARDLGYLRRADLVAMNLDRLVADAKETALGLVRSEWRQTAPAPTEPSIRVLGRGIQRRREARRLHDAARRIYIRIRCIGRAQARPRPGRRRAHVIATRQRAISAGPRARSVRLPLRRTQNPGTHRPHPEDRQAAA